MGELKTSRESVEWDGSDDLLSPHVFMELIGLHPHAPLPPSVLFHTE